MGSLGGVILQERVEDKGAVVYIFGKDKINLTVAGSPEEAVLGIGKSFTGPLETTLDESSLESIKEDLYLLLCITIKGE